MTKKISAILFLFFMTSCQSVTKKSGDFHDVEIFIPPPPTLKPFKFDIPRDTTRLVVRNTSDCMNVPEDERNEEFWKKCGIHPPLDNTNIFIGLDRESFKNLLYDLEVMEEDGKMLRKILKNIEEQFGNAGNENESGISEGIRSE